jgi:hypothetical protein
VNWYRVGAIQVNGYTSVNAVDIISGSAGGNSYRATPVSHTNATAALVLAILT